MSWTRVPPARIRMTQDGTVASSAGPRIVEGDTQYGEVTATAPAHSPAEGPLDVRNLSTDTFGVALDGTDTVNGVSGPVNLGSRQSMLMLAGNDGWIVFEPLAI